MGEVHQSVDLDTASEFVCQMYAQGKTRDVNEARYIKLMQMTGKVEQDNPLVNIKRVDCALLPPSRPALDMKIRRAQYVTTLWTHAMTASPADGLLHCDYRWSVNGNLLKPIWFKGPAISNSLFVDGHNYAENMEVEADGESESELEIIDELESDSDEPWSENSDTEEEGEQH